jgi:hypothetical protein
MRRVRALTCCAYTCRRVVAVLGDVATVQRSR